MNYFEQLNSEIKEYFKILSLEFPKWLLPFIKTEEMVRIGTIGMNCGTDYIKIYNNKYFYTRLEHSIAVALIIWNFTNDKKQTLAGLFHDIATPCFSHCIDYLHEDYLEMEYTENKTQKILENSNEIQNLLKKEGIKLEEVCDYKIYPIADNPKPKLSADRLEYNFSSGLTFTKIWNLSDIKRIYDNLEIMKNENGEDELGFKNLEIAKDFLKGTIILFKEYQMNRNKLVMQFYADILKYLINKGKIREEDLYKFSEREIIHKIEICGIKDIEDIFKKFREMNFVCEGDIEPFNNYYISIDVKKRYINPLVNGKRIDEISKESKGMLDELLNYKSKNYAWFPFEVKGVI